MTVIRLATSRTEPVNGIEPIYVAIGQRVMEERHKAGWTQHDLACQVGLARTSVANVELGRQRLMLHHVLAFSDVLSIPPGELLGAGIAVHNADATRKQLRDEIHALRRRVSDLEGVLSSISRKCVAIGPSA